MKKKILGIGEVLFDILPDGRKLGGAPVNFAYHVHQLGAEELAVSAVGNDELGSEALELMGEKGINFIVPVVSAPTGTAVVSLDAKRVPTFTITENVAWDRIPFSDELAKIAAECDAVCFGTLAQRSDESRNTIRRVLDRVPKGAMVIYDINLRQNYYSKSLVEESLRICNLLKINDSEFDVITGLLGCPFTGYEQASHFFMEKYGLKMLILTCGEHGSYVFAGDEASFEPTPEVEVVDTVGAGDSFTAAFCASILGGMSVKEAHRRAVEVSAFVCTRSGAMPELPAKYRII